MGQRSPQTTYRFFIDGKPYESAEQSITGAQLRAIANIEAKRHIFLGETHREGVADRQVTNTTSVNLAEPGEEKFYTLPPPSYDIY